MGQIMSGDNISSESLVQCENSWDENEEVEISRFIFEGNFCIWVKVLVHRQDGQWKSVIDVRTKFHDDVNPSDKFVINEHFLNIEMVKEWLEINHPGIFEKVKAIF